ncbi:NAD-dependent epimerase/dehydratase family protein [Chitinophaga sp. CF418]|uniref:NAD-dependent epimerase/dehydratase family protein n=1 Tax=Chitinophaga sp. CF418 TaxID=1855287 RepID=UPI000912506D|nr:NAD-dependent epimerase/dehydratase family protein [Chitinophaga sp. CF418]SHN35865.1 Nucleoside-diphosphate-sugar epimerase [Chitinophaga sp. CF418]
MGLHTLVGADGMISSELLMLLKQRKENVRLVSSTPLQFAEIEHRTADIQHYEQLLKAVAGSTVIYLSAIFPFDSEFGAIDWITAMRNVINASKESCAKLVYLDQAHLYGKVSGVIAEDTPYRPCSDAGVTAARMATLLQREMEEGTIKATIARMTDFFGPGLLAFCKTNRMIFHNLWQRKRARWLIDADNLRTFNYCPDIANALYILASNKVANGHIWHMPAAKPAIPVRQFIQLASIYMEAPDKPLVIPSWLLKAMQPFDPSIQAVHEISCQEGNSFIFSSEKFEKTFHFSPTPYHVSIKETAEWYMKQEKGPFL